MSQYNALTLLDELNELAIEYSLIVTRGDPTIEYIPTTWSFKRNFGADMFTADVVHMDWSCLSRLISFVNAHFLHLYVHSGDENHVRLVLSPVDLHGDYKGEKGD